MADPGTERFTEVDGLRLRWVEYGDRGRRSGAAHPRMAHLSYLWRGVAPGIAERGRRVIAIDLPGFGGSDKPVDATYSFGFYGRALDGVLEAAGADRIGLGVHDLGGPVGLHWASKNPERVERLALLNTLAYPGLSVALVTFFALLRTPGVRSWATSPAGLRFTMRTGVADKARLSDEDIAAYQAPYGRRRRAQGAAALGPRHAPGRHEGRRGVAEDGRAPGADHLRSARPDPARRREDDAEGRARRAGARRDDRARGLRALLPGRAPRGDRRGAGGVLRPLQARRERRSTRTGCEE